MKSNFPIDSTLRLVSFLGSALIFLSILKSYIFYATFGISITNYISFSEAILLFLNEVAIFLLYFLILSGGLFIAYIIFYFLNPHIRPIDIFIPDRASSFIHKLFCSIIIFYPISYLFFAIVINTRNHSSSKNFFFWLISLSVVDVCIIVGAIGWWKKIRLIKNAVQNKVFVYILFASVLFFYTWSLDRQLFLFHRNKINKQVVGWSKDAKDGGRPIQLTNDTIQYLGSTSKYIFCFDLAWEKAIVIDASQFNRVEFRTYKDLPGFSVFDLLFH